MGMLTATLLLAATACGSSSPGDKATDVADQICACKDMTCASKVLDSAKDLDKVKEKDLSKDEAAKFEKAGDRIRECMTKLAAAPK
ncbi:MAG TPA: hypothetical protein VFG83_11430 [Kofleriaceae bacterium]|nr:hypothetical protein [Kofleriaceae bacterium]